MTLPNGVQPVVNRHGRVYYYYAPRRGTKSAGQRIALGSVMHEVTPCGTFQRGPIW